MNRLIAPMAVAGLVAAATLASAAPADAQEAVAEPCVQKIAVVNNAAFVMNFKVATRDSIESYSTQNYPINQYRVIDLATVATIPENTDVRPVVKAVAGDTRSGDFVGYCKNGQTATYSVTGTTLNYQVTLIG